MAGSDDLMTGLESLLHSRNGYDDAWSFWQGSRDEEFVSPAVKRALRLSEGRYQVNVAKIPIHSLTDRLSIASVTALTAAGDKDQPVDDILQGALTANRMGLQWMRLFRNTAVYGDGYLFIWPVVDQAGLPLPGQVSIAYNSPLVARVIYDSDNDMVPVFAVKKWVDARQRIRANLYYLFEEGGGYVEKWLLDENSKPDDPKAWDRDPEAGDDIQIPAGAGLVHFRNDMPYGTPAHVDAWGPQDALNKLSTTMAHTSEAAGFPQRWALTDPGAALDGNGGDSPDWDDDSDADIITEDDSRLRGGPGELSILSGIKATGDWTSANSAAFLDPSEFYVRMIAALTRSPLRYIDQRGAVPSGESLRVADAPLMSMVKTVQLYFDDAAQTSMSNVLTILGFPDHKVDVRWTPPGIVDDMTTWQLVQLKVANGVPPRIAFAETGLYDQTEIDGWFSDPDGEMDIARRIALLSQVGTAMTGLAQGVAVGAIDQGQVRAIVDATLGQLAPEIVTPPVTAPIDTLTDVDVTNL